MAIDDALPALQAAIAVSKNWPGWGTDPLVAGQAPVVIISELRQIAGDPGFMSPTPCDSLSIHFTFGHHPTEVMQCVMQLEDALAPFDGKPALYFKCKCAALLIFIVLQPVRTGVSYLVQDI